jgi:hypothetical protein
MANIDPKQRVRVILLSIADNFKTAAEAIEKGDEAKMMNWMNCGLNCLAPLAQSIKMLHPERQPITERLKEDTNN